MSWKSGRLLKLRSGHVELDPICQLEKDQLDNLIAEMQSIESVAKSTYIAAKNLEKHTLGCNKFELSLACNLSHCSKIFFNDSAMCKLLEECNSYARISSTNNNDFINSLKKTIIFPLELLKRAMNEIRAEFKVYCALEKYIIKLQRKYAKMSDRPRSGPTCVKLQDTKLNLALRRNDFTKLTQQLVTKLAKFTLSSKELLNSVIKGFVAAEMSWLYLSERPLKHGTLKDIPAGIETDRNKFMSDSIKALDSLGICQDQK